MAPGQAVVTVHRQGVAYPACAVGHLLVGSQFSRHSALRGADAHTPAAHRHLGALALLTHLELGAEHPHFAAGSVHQERLTGMRNLEECRAMQQPHTALTLGEIDRNGATCIKRYL